MKRDTFHISERQQFGLLRAEGHRVRLSAGRRAEAAERRVQRPRERGRAQAGLPRPHRDGALHLQGAEARAHAHH